MDGGSAVLPFIRADLLFNQPSIVIGQSVSLSSFCTAPGLCILTPVGPDRVRVSGVLSCTPVSRAGGAPCDGFTWSFSWSS